MQNENWGTKNTPTTTVQCNTAQNHTGDIYHMAYAKTLKTLGNIIIFGLPLIIAILSYTPLRIAMRDAAALGCLIIYGVMAIILWITVSYAVNLFDNIANMAQNTESIARALDNKKDN